MPKQQYYNVVTNRRDGSAELFLYGMIGYAPYDNDGDGTRDLRDIAVVKAINELSGMSRINVRINSPGGDIAHGEAIISALRRSPAEVHTYVDGVAASMAAQIFLAGKKRHMGMGSKLMIHGAHTYVYGNSQDLRTEADNLDVFDAGLVAHMAATTGMSKEDVKAKYFDGRDHWMSADDCLALGIIEEIEDYEASAPEGLENMEYREMVNQFARLNKQEGFFQQAFKLLNFFAGRKESAADQPPAGTPAPNPEPVIIIEPMTVENIQTALAAGEVTVAQLQELITAQTPPPAPVAVDPPAAPAPDLAAAIAALTAKVEALATAPGALGTRVATNGNDHIPAGKTELDLFNERLQQAAATGDIVRFQ